MTPIRLALPAVAAAAFLAMPAFAAEPLALKRVLLSTGGVGYFEYEARSAATRRWTSPCRSTRSTT